MKFVVCFNYGVVLANWGRVDDAIKSYTLATELNPAFAHPRINLGLAFERLGKHPEAIAQWRLIQNDPKIKENAPLEIKTTALNHIGRLHEINRNFEESEKALTESLHLNGDQTDCLHHWFHIRQKQCEWPVISNLPNTSPNRIITSMSPLAALAYEDNNAFQMYVGDRIVKQKFTYDVQYLSERKKYGHNKLRIGYLSGDLCTHAVGLILIELFELHDRKNFEIFLYDYGREDGTALRQRYKDNIENFVNIGALTDAQAAVKIRSDEIDILVDLHGLSLGIRAEIIAHRPAPIQMTYLGYIGTTMLPSIDYVITDKFCFQDYMRPYYSEEPILLDHCCLPTDRKKEVAPTTSRKEEGLPEDKFIFVTFNNSYKLNERMFSSWINILKRVSNSVLWIIDDNPAATRNLKIFAAKNSLDPERLVFTPRVVTSHYIGRMPLADIFLDNHPYNAGSTASDIMWMGVPMITLAGETFVSRMAGSLLFHAGLEELIATNHMEYEDLAVKLSSDPQKLSEIKKKMLAQREPGGSFDMLNFTKSLEENYVRAFNKLTD